VAWLTAVTAQERAKCLRKYLRECPLNRLRECLI
jgi:hypothetical protein